MTEKHDTPSAALLAATNDVVEERGWVLIGESSGVYTAELPGTLDPTVSSASADSFFAHPARRGYGEYKRVTPLV